MSKLINFKVEQTILDKVVKIAKKKYPLRGIDNYAKAIREALIDFVNKNKKILEENIEIQDQEQNQEVLS